MTAGLLANPGTFSGVASHLVCRHDYDPLPLGRYLGGIFVDFDQFAGRGLIFGGHQTVPVAQFESGLESGPAVTERRQRLGGVAAPKARISTPPKTQDLV